MSGQLPRDAREQFSQVPGEPHVVTIGNFDGVHRGHQYLITLVKERGAALDARPLVITFEPHPISVLRPGAGFLRLTPSDAKLALLRHCGVDDIVVIPFTHEFSQVTAEQFLDAVYELTAARAIVVGEGFRFGHGRAGDGSTIKHFAARHDFEAHVVPRLADGDATISSSFVRTALLSGDLQGANRALGRRFRIYGRVERGLSRGRKMGYPTANLATDDDLLIPTPGIYAVYVHLSGRTPLPGMLYIGNSPTFDPRGQTVEAHILDFNEEIYGEEIEVELIDYVREDRQFKSVDALVDQMQHDEMEIRAILRGQSPEAPSGEIL